MAGEERQPHWHTEAGPLGLGVREKMRLRTPHQIQ